MSVHLPEHVAADGKSAAWKCYDRPQVLLLCCPAQDVPFLLEDKLKEDGALYTKGQDWHSHAVFDGNLVTGEPFPRVAA